MGVIVLRMPIYCDWFGQKTTRPSDVKDAPKYALDVDVPWGTIFANVSVVGLKRPTFEFVNGVMATWPFGRRTPPAKPLAPAAIMFENEPDVGFRTTTFPFVYGTHTTFPLGVKTPPKNPGAITMFENVSAVGEYCITFDVPKGIPMIFPFGRRTPPTSFGAVVEIFTIFENSPVEPLYEHTFREL